MTKSTRTRRVMSLVASLAVASLVLASCALRTNSDATDTQVEADTVGVAENLLAFYEQDVNWQSCDAGMQCATLTAPLDWSEPEAGEIDLSLIRSSATDGDALGSLLVNPGGPGASGIALVRDSLDFAVGSELSAAYDVIGFDPRGVGESSAVRCYDAEDMDAYLFDIADGQRGSAAWTEEIETAQKGFAAACEQNSAGILAHITTINSARDMDLIRAVVGDTSLNYLGYSYGAFLGATYAELYPDKVGRLVLDGAIDPSISGLDVGTTQALGFESALRAYMADCLETESCPFAGTVDDAMSDLATLLASVDRTPLANADGRMLGADALLTAIVTALYAQASWPYLSGALADVMAGDPGTAFSLADFYYERVDGVYEDNSTEAFNAYNCMDYPATETAAEEAAADQLLADKAPTVAPYWSGPDLCEQWPYEPTGVRDVITASGADPILVVGTTNDPATPYEWSVALAEQLESGVLITRVGEGHTGFNKGNACVDDAVKSYFLTGKTPQADITC